MKFSGGRSAAALVLELDAAGALSAERGDVVLFANTSGEHPGIYIRGPMLRPDRTIAGHEFPFRVVAPRRGRAGGSFRYG